MNEKILVINDDTAAREFIQNILKENGYQTIEATTGALGIKQAYDQKPDLILLDLVMPEMDGYETCQLLKAVPETKDIPVLFCASPKDSKVSIKGMELGAEDFITDIADPAEIITRVHTILKIQLLSRSLVAMNEEIAKKQKALDGDQKAAAIIQQSFVMASRLELPRLDLASIWLPANPVAGDMCNVIQSGQGKIVLFMVDVSGHDVPSALLSVSVSQYLKQQNADPTKIISPKQMMLNLNKEYPFERFDRYFTIFYIVLDTTTGVYSYSCGGHPPAVLLSKNQGLRILERGGASIGLDAGLIFEDETRDLSPGDKIVIYTDGVIETLNEKNEFYGIKKLYLLLNTIKNESPVEIIKKIQLSLDEFRQGVKPPDDTCIMCFEYKT